MLSASTKGWATLQATLALLEDGWKGHYEPLTTQDLARIARIAVTAAVRAFETGKETES